MRLLSHLAAIGTLAVAALPVSGVATAAAASADPACVGVTTSTGNLLSEAGRNEGTYRATRTPSDPLFPEQWALATAVVGAGGIDAPGAWDITTGSRTVTVAVVDSGIDLNSDALAANIATNAGEVGDGRETNGIDDDGNGYVDDWRGWDFAEGDAEPQDRDGHGTNVAGIIGARGNDARNVTGVAWEVSLLPLRVLADDGSGSTVAISEAMTYAAQRGARVVNLSLGGPGESDSMLRAICAAPEVLFVAAAGNDATNLDGAPFYPCADTPANVVCVAASDQQDRLAGFSSYSAVSVDLAAPGELILGLGLNGQTAVYSGTSMAAPQVSGVAALLFSQHPDWTAAQVKDALLANVDPLPELAGRVMSGGRLNAARALAPQPPVAPEARAAAQALKPHSIRRVQRFLRIAVRVPAAGTVSIVVSRQSAGGRIAIARVAIGVRRAGLKTFNVRVARERMHTLQSATSRRLVVSVSLVERHR